MRHRIREQSYLDPELNRQVRAYEAAKGWTHSAFTTAAYERFLAAERGGADLVLSRIDTLVQRLERLQNAVDLAAMAFARYVEGWCRFLPLTAGAGLHAEGGPLLRQVDARGRGQVQRRSQVERRGISGR